MPKPENVFVKRFNDGNYGELIFIILLFSIVGTTFMAFNQLKSGFIYLALITMSFAVLGFLTYIRKDEDKLTELLPIPFANKFSVSVVMYILGLSVPFILSFLFMFSNLSLQSFSVPLFAGELAEAPQSFSVANLESQMSTKIFNIVYVAGSDETVVYNWLAMLFGVIAGSTVYRFLGREDKKRKVNKTFVKLFAYAFSMLVFVLSHVLNSSYTSPLNFAIAGGFLLISNICIYELGVPLSFWVGYHQSNNLLYLIAVFGLVAVIEGFIGLFGLVTVSIFALLIVWLIFNWDLAWRDMLDWVTS